MISMILAVAKNGVIGLNGKMPWHIPADFKWFREKTTNQVVVMGRTTFESLNNKPLKDRINVVVSSKEIPTADKTITSYNDDELVSTIETLTDLYPDKEIFIMGGAKLYEATKFIVDKVYLTEIDHDYEGDTYFDKSFVKNMSIEYSTILPATGNQPEVHFTIYNW